MEQDHVLLLPLFPGLVRELELVLELQLVPLLFWWCARELLPGPARSCDESAELLEDPAAC